MSYIPIKRLVGRPLRPATSFLIFKALGDGIGGEGKVPRPLALCSRFLFPSLATASPVAAVAPAPGLGGPGLGRPGRDLFRGAALQQFGFRGVLDLDQHPGLGVEGQAGQAGRQRPPVPQQRSYSGFQGQNLGDVVMALPGEFDAPQGFLDPLMDELPQVLEIFRKVGALFQKRG